MAFIRPYLFVFLVSLLGNMLSLCELGLEDANPVVLHIGSVLQTFAGSGVGVWWRWSLVELEGSSIPNSKWEKRGDITVTIIRA